MSDRLNFRSNIAVDFTFTGAKNTYPELIAKHDQDLQISKIGYIKNPAEITRRLTKPVYPERITAGFGGQEGRDHESAKRLDEYNAKSRLYTKNVEKVDEDFGVAIGLFSKRLSTAVRTEIESLTNLEIDQPNREKYQNMLQHIYNHYGPRNLTDIESLKTILCKADDSQGYKHLMYLHRHIQNQLRKIYKRDAAGVIIVSATGIPVTYEFSEDELRSILMDQLGKSNEVFERVRLDAIKKPTKSYAELVEECENLLKDNKVERSSSSFGNPSTRQFHNLDERSAISIGRRPDNEEEEVHHKFIGSTSSSTPSGRRQSQYTPQYQNNYPVRERSRSRSSDGRNNNQHGQSYNNYDNMANNFPRGNNRRSHDEHYRRNRQNNNRHVSFGRNHHHFRNTNNNNLNQQQRPTFRSNINYRNTNSPRSHSPVYGTTDRRKEIRSFLANISNEDRNIMLESIGMNGEAEEQERNRTQQQIPPNFNENNNYAAYYQEERCYDDPTNNNINNNNNDIHHQYNQYYLGNHHNNNSELVDPDTL